MHLKYFSLSKSMYVVKQIRKMIALTNALKRWRKYLLFSLVAHPSHAPEKMINRNNKINIVAKVAHMLESSRIEMQQVYNNHKSLSRLQKLLTFLEPPFIDC